MDNTDQLQSPVRVTINGACGRMGLEIIRCVLAEPRALLASLWEHSGHPFVGKTDPTSGRLIAGQWEGECGDVIIDFSSESGLLGIMAQSRELQRPLVCGTTGLQEETLNELSEMGRHIPIFHAPNMSLGIHVLHRLVEEAVHLIGEPWDVEIVEIHHNLKSDAPSGTALSLARRLAGAMPEKPEFRYGREGILEPRLPSELGIHAVRAGDVVGEHEVILAGRGEVLRLRHSALSRAVFAHGAVRAALWLAFQPPGYYGMDSLVAARKA